MINQSSQGSGTSMDFALGISQRTNRGLSAAKTVIGLIAQDVTNISAGHRKAEDAIIRQTELLEYNQRATEKIADMLGSAKLFLIWATGIYSITQALDGLFSAGEKVDDLLQRQQVAFNGYSNALAFYQKKQADVIAGQAYGSAEEYMDAASVLMRKGVHMTDTMTKTLDNWAAATGKSVTQVSSAIESAISGNTAAFEEFGITERSLRHLQRYTANTTQMKDAVLRFVSAQKQFEDMAKTAPLTWRIIANRIKAMKDRFIEAIIGRANDPNSLNSMVKRTVKDVLDFMHRNAATFKAIAAVISATLKWMFKQIGSFVTWVVGRTQQSIDSLQKFVNNYKERTAGFILWLELIKMRVVDFLKVHGDTIKTIVKWYLYFKVARWALLIPTKIILSIVTFTGKIRTLLGIIAASNTWNFLVGFVQGVTRQFQILTRAMAIARVGALGFNAALLANPVGLIIVSVIALVGWVVYLYKNWDQVRKRVQSVNSVVLVLGSILLPIIGLPLLMAKYWNQVRAIVFNLMQVIKNMGVVIWKVFQLAFIKVKNLMVGVFKSLWAYLPDWLKDFGGFIYNSLARAVSKIYDFFSGLVPDWLKDTFSWLSGKVDSVFDFLSNGTKNLADATAKLASDMGGQGYQGRSSDWYAKKDQQVKLLNEGAITPTQYTQAVGEPAPSVKAKQGPVVADYPATLARPQGNNVTDNTTTVNMTVNAQGADADEVARKVEDRFKKMQRAQDLKGRQ